MVATESPETLPVAAVPHLIDYVNQLTLTLTQTSPTVGTSLDILDFYETAATLYSEVKLLPHLEVTIPPPLLVYLVYFSPSLAVVSRLCGILATYKRAWEAVMSPAVPRELTPRERGHINVFNGFLMDLCNCLWRGRAFSTSDVNAQGCRIPQNVQAALETYLRAADPGLALGSAFGLSHSPLLCLQSLSYVQQLEEDAMGGEACWACDADVADTARHERRLDAVVAGLQVWRAGVPGGEGAAWYPRADVQHDEEPDEGETAMREAAAVS
jgi:centromere protein I